MKKHLFLLSSILVVILTYSCHPRRYAYASPAANNPFFTQKGDSKIAGFISTAGSHGSAGPGKDSSYNVGFDLQAAYAFHNNWAVTMLYYNRNEKDNYYQNSASNASGLVNYTRNMAELGAGYFSKMRGKELITFNLYGGIGTGAMHIKDRPRNTGRVDDFEAKFTKFYLQPGFNFMEDKIVQVGLNTRFTVVKFNDVETNFKDFDLRLYNLDILTDKAHIFFEPGIHFKISHPQIQWVSFEGTANANINWFSFLSTRKICFSIGLNFDLLKLK